MERRSPAAKWFLWIGSIGPLGYVPASGTVTVAVCGLPLFWLMHAWPWHLYAGTIVALAFAAVWIHQRGDRILGEHDSRKLVWDELVGYLVAVAFLPFTWQIALIAFIVERAIDIVKVPPARQIERSWPGGWGVVGDDLVAGLYALMVMQAFVAFRPQWVGLTA